MLCTGKIQKFEKIIFSFGKTEFLRESIHGYPTGEARGGRSGGMGWAGGGQLIGAHTRTQSHTGRTHAHSTVVSLHVIVACVPLWGV